MQLVYISNLPVVNYSEITIVHAILTLAPSNANSLNVVLTISGTNIPDNTIVTITLTGFMVASPLIDQVNQVQESLNHYILSLTLNNNYIRN